MNESLRERWLTGSSSVWDSAGWLAVYCGCIISLEIIQQAKPGESDILSVVYLGHDETIKIGTYTDPEDAVRAALEFVLNERYGWLQAHLTKEDDEI